MYVNETVVLGTCHSQSMDVSPFSEFQLDMPALLSGSNDADLLGLGLFQTKDQTRPPFSCMRCVFFALARFSLYLRLKAQDGSVPPCSCVWGFCAFLDLWV